MTKLLAATMVVGLTIVSAIAQPLAIVKVPFGFRVGNTELPAGSYEIEAVAMNAVRITNVENRSVAVAINPIPITRSDASTYPAKLVFNRYGRHCYLSEIWSSGSLTGRAVPKSEREAELAKRIQPVHIDLITTSRP